MTTVERGLKATVLQPHTGCNHRVSLSICLCVIENTAKRKWLPVSALTCLWSRNLCQKKYGAYNDITPHNLTMGSPRIVSGCLGSPKLTGNQLHSWSTWVSIRVLCRMVTATVATGIMSGHRAQP